MKTLFDAQIVTRYGGSIRCVVSSSKKNKTSRLNDLIENEKKLLINNSTFTYENFANKIINSKEKIVEMISKLKNDNKRIIAKSCPARAVVLLNYCELNSTHIDYISEQPTSLKLDYFVPGTNLQIKSDNTLIDDKPDYLLLLAWHLSDPIMNKWNKRGLKSKYIVPLPEVKII